MCSTLIRSYAPQVLYDGRGILEKNRDTFRDDILFILKDSRWDKPPKYSPGWADVYLVFSGTAVSLRYSGLTSAHTEPSSDPSL